MNTCIDIVQKSNLNKIYKNKIISNLEYNFKPPLVEVKNIFDVLLCFWWHKSYDGFDFWNTFYTELYSEYTI